MQITNGTTPTLVFLMVSSTDDKTAVTGITPVVQISKAGGSFAGAANAVTEIANGWYKVTLTATETNTDGALIQRATGTGADEWRDVHQVLTTNPANVVSIANDAITAAAIATDAIGSAEVSAAAVTKIQAGLSTYAGGAVASVTGSVGSVATGGITAASFTAGAIDASAIATDAIGSAEVSAAAVTKIQAGLMTSAGYTAPPSAATIAAAVWDYLTSAATTVGSLGKLIVDNLNATVSSRLASASYTTPPTVGAIADQVWEETLADHSGTVGSTAAALNAAGSAGDPWSTALPGAYGAGTAGKIVGDNINATISSRSTFSGGAVASVTGAVGSVTGNVGGSIGSLGTQAKADVNAEAVDALATDTYAEPGSVPAATSSIKDKIGWLTALARNKRTTTSTTDTLRNDADSGTIGSSTISDDGTTFTRGEYS